MRLPGEVPLLLVHIPCNSANVNVCASVTDFAAHIVLVYRCQGRPQVAHMTINKQPLISDSAHLSRCGLDWQTTAHAQAVATTASLQGSPAKGQCPAHTASRSCCPDERVALRESGAASRSALAKWTGYNRRAGRGGGGGGCASSMHKRVNCIQTQYLAAEQFLQELVVAGLKQAKVRIHAIRELCHACSTHPPQLCWKPRRGCGALGTGPSTRHTQETKSLLDLCLQ